VTPLTPTERQTLLRRLKRSPALSRAALASHAKNLEREVISKRKEVQ
jgi:hypothetical protein